MKVNFMPTNSKFRHLLETIVRNLVLCNLWSTRIHACGWMINSSHWTSRMCIACRLTVSGVRGGRPHLPQKADPSPLWTNTCENITFPILRMRAVVKENDDGNSCYGKILIICSAGTSYKERWLWACFGNVDPVRDNVGETCCSVWRGTSWATLSGRHRLTEFTARPMILH